MDEPQRPRCDDQGIAAWQPVRMIDEFAKRYLHQELQWVRAALVWKLDGLGEYDIRRPLTPTGTNLLGLVKHMATWEARYLGQVFNRPFPASLPPSEDSDGSDLWVTERQSREQIIEFYQRASAHSDDTIQALPVDAAGYVPWWPQPDVTLFSVMTHVLNDTTRHAGHADILREQLDGRTGVAAEQEEQNDPTRREKRRAMIDRSAKAATGSS